MRLLLLPLVFVPFLVSAAPLVTVAPRPDSGVLRAGEEARAELTFAPVENAPATLTISLRRDGGAELAKPEVVFTGGRAELAATLPGPGAVLARIEGVDAKGEKFSARAGWIFSPEKIEPAVPRPDDFDAFWDTKLAALAKVAPNAVWGLGKVSPDSIPQGVEYIQFSLAVSATERVRGQLAHPKQAGKEFPALVIFQYAGVYPLAPGTVLGNASKGWLAVNVSAHDQPIDEPKAYYDALGQGALKDYGSIGKGDRETSYFLRMFLGVRRALDLVRAHPAWDGRVLVAHGTSQGGTQAIIAAALDPAVTAVVANVPAFCDQNGPEVGRGMPFPYWLAKLTGSEREAAASAARYFDPVHFAPRIRVPVLVSAGLIDESCPPSGIAAMANRLAGPHEILFMPQANHQGVNDTHAPYKARSVVWLDALRAGRPAPLAGR